MCWVCNSITSPGVWLARRCKAQAGFCGSSGSANNMIINGAPAGGKQETVLDNRAECTQAALYRLQHTTTCWSTKHSKLVQTVQREGKEAVHIKGKAQGCLLLNVCLLPFFFVTQCLAKRTPEGRWEKKKKNHDPSHELHSHSMRSVSHKPDETSLSRQPSGWENNISSFPL